MLKKKPDDLVLWGVPKGDVYHTKCISPSKKYSPELCDDLFLDGRLHLKMDHLLCNDCAGRQMANTVNHLMNEEK